MTNVELLITVWRRKYQWPSWQTVFTCIPLTEDPPFFLMSMGEEMKFFPQVVVTTLSDCSSIPSRWKSNVGWFLWPKLTRSSNCIESLLSVVELWTFGIGNVMNHSRCQCIAGMDSLWTVEGTQHSACIYAQGSRGVTLCLGRCWPYVPRHWCSWPRSPHVCCRWALVNFGPWKSIPHSCKYLADSLCWFSRFCTFWTL